jgi:hypothetical protein
MSSRIKFFAILAAGSLVAMIAFSVLGYVLQARHALDDPDVARISGPVAGAVFIALFLQLGVSLVPLMIRLFVVLQTRIGNGELRLVQVLAAHERGVVYGVWALFGSGLAIAAPVMLHDLGLLRPSGGPSEGVLVARIGMTLDEMRQRSSLMIQRARARRSPARRRWSARRFDFEIADSAMRFRLSLLLHRTGDLRRSAHRAISIGVSPQTMSRAELVAAHRRVQAALRADGWQPGRYSTPRRSSNSSTAARRRAATASSGGRARRCSGSRQTHGRRAARRSRGHRRRLIQLLEPPVRLGRSLRFAR